MQNDTITLEEMRALTKDCDPKIKSHKHYMVDAVIMEMIKVLNAFFYFYQNL